MTSTHHEQSKALSIDALERQRAEAYLNRGIGPIWLSNPRIGTLIEDALLYFDGRRSRLHAWVVMTPLLEASVSHIVSSWKSFTSKRANALLGRTGAFWQADYFDRYVRDERHFAAAVSYAEQNPVVAGLCAEPEGWAFSSARRRSEHPNRFK